MNYYNEAKKYEKAFLEDLKEIIAVPSLRNIEEASENAPFGPECRKVLDIMLNKAKADGFKVIDYNGYAGVIEYGEGEETVGVLGHLDVVPIGEGWSKDPLGCEIKDGYVFGRGVLDDKGPTLCGYYALKMIRDLNIKLNRRVLLIMGCDEESGMQCMDYYKKHGEIPTMGFTPDADFPVIYGEKGILDFQLTGEMNSVIKYMKAGERPNIVIGKAIATLTEMNAHQKAMFDYYLNANNLEGSVKDVEDGVEVCVHGKYMHSAYCYNGVNAALHLLNFVGITYNDSMAKKLHDVLIDWKGSGLGIDVYGAYMGFLTMNTGIVHIENGKFNVTIDIRYPNDVDGKTLVSKAKHALENTGIELVNETDSKPLFVNPQSKLVQDLMSSYHKYSGDTFSPAKTMGGGTYARKFENFVAFGPEFPSGEKPDFYVGGPHEKDEAVCIDDMMKAIAIYTDAIEKLGN